MAAISLDQRIQIFRQKTEAAHDRRTGSRRLEPATFAEKEEAVTLYWDAKRQGRGAEVAGFLRSQVEGRYLHQGAGSRAATDVYDSVFYSDQDLFVGD
jgi:hypothetical protein